MATKFYTLISQAVQLKKFLSYSQNTTKIFIPSKYFFPSPYLLPLLSCFFILGCYSPSRRNVKNTQVEATSLKNGNLLSILNFDGRLLRKTSSQRLRILTSDILYWIRRYGSVYVQSTTSKWKNNCLEETSSSRGSGANF